MKWRSETIFTAEPDQTNCPGCGGSLRHLYNELKKLESDPVAWAELLLSIDCPSCRSSNWANIRRLGTCETCGQPMENHLHCEDCGIFAGLGHECLELTNGKCRTCATGEVVRKDE